MMAEPSPRPDYKSDNFGQQAYATKPRRRPGLLTRLNRLLGLGSYPTAL